MLSSKQINHETITIISIWQVYEIVENKCRDIDTHYILNNNFLFFYPFSSLSVDLSFCKHTPHISLSSFHVFVQSAFL